MFSLLPREHKQKYCSDAVYICSSKTFPREGRNLGMNLVIFASYLRKFLRTYTGEQNLRRTLSFNTNSESSLLCVSAACGGDKYPS